MATGGSPPASLLICNLPAGIDADFLDLFFSSRKNGGSGDVEHVEFPLDDQHSTSARITFSRPSTVITICSAERVLKGRKLKLEPENIEDLGNTDAAANIITPLKEVNFCTQHPGEDIRYVCNTQACDGVLICARCVRDEHKEHAWTFIEDELREKKTEVTKVVLPDLTSGAASLKQGVDTLKDKQQEVERSLKAELVRVETSRTTNLAKLETEYDDNLKKLKHDFNEQQDKINKEANRVCDSIKSKWDSRKTELGDAEQKCSDQLTEMNSVIALAQGAETQSDLKSVVSTIKRAMASCRAGVSLQTLPSTDATAPDTPFDLERSAELTITLLPKTGQATQTTTVKVTAAPDASHSALAMYTGSANPDVESSTINNPLPNAFTPHVPMLTALAPGFYPPWPTSTPIASPPKQTEILTNTQQDSRSTTPESSNSKPQPTLRKTRDALTGYSLSTIFNGSFEAPEPIQINAEGMIVSPRYLNAHLNKSLQCVESIPSSFIQAATASARPSNSNLYDPASRLGPVYHGAPLTTTNSQPVMRSASNVPDNLVAANPHVIPRRAATRLVQDSGNGRGRRK